MGLFGSLYVGTSGLQANQNALNTTAHNMSNLDTPGYVRQQVYLTARSYNTVSFSVKGVSNRQIGMGVNYAQTRHIRSEMLDKRFRQEAGRSGFYQVTDSTIYEIEQLFGEVIPGANENAFHAFLQNLNDSLQELYKTPGEKAAKDQVIANAQRFMEEANLIYDGLSRYQDNLNLQVKASVDMLNNAGREIVDLNKRIADIEAGGTEGANDLRDRRDYLLDQMGAVVKMTYKEESSGVVNIQIEGEPFVNDGRLNEIGLKQEIGTGFYKVFWPHNAKYTQNADGSKDYDPTGAEVFNLTHKISSEANTDIGTLKSLLTGRGDHRANYTDMSDPAHYNKNISNSLIMNAQAQFDQIIHNITTEMNKVFADVSQPDPPPYLFDSEEGPLQLFQKIASPGYTLNPNTGLYEYNLENNAQPNKNTQSLYTTSNLKVNTKLLNNEIEMDFKKSDGEMDFDTLKALGNVLTKDNYTLNPNTSKKNNLIDCYGDLVLQVGNAGYMAVEQMNNQTKVVNWADGARQQIMAVSSEEELENMIKFQNAYNAASRYINVVNEMLEHLVTSLG